MRWGQLGSPLPAPRVFGCCHVFGSAAGEGWLWARRPHPLSEPGEGKEQESRWCLQGGHPVPVPFPQKLEAPVPPPRAPCSLPCPSVFIDPASWRFPVRLPLDLPLPIPGGGEKSQGVTTENRPNQVFCCRVGKIGRRRGRLFLQSALNTNDFTEEGAWTWVSGCDVPVRTNVAFHFSGIKRKPLELYWNQSPCVLESIWLACTSGVTAVWGSRQKSMGFWPSAPAWPSSRTSGCCCWL